MAGVFTSFYYLRKQFGCRSRIDRLVQPILSFEVAERANVRQRKRETIFIFVTHRSQGKAPILQVQTATVPGITRLRRRVLQRAIVRVKTEAAGGAQAALVELTVAKQHPKLLEIADVCACGGSMHSTVCRRRSRYRIDNSQKSIASPNGKWTVVIVHKRH